MAVNYTYNCKFDGNILIVGQIGFGKTTFIQNLAKNNMFLIINNVFCLTKIVLSKDREQNIRLCFNAPVQFLYLQTWDDFNMHLDFFLKNR